MNARKVKATITDAREWIRVEHLLGNELARDVYASIISVQPLGDAGERWLRLVAHAHVGQLKAEWAVLLLKEYEQL